MQNARHAFPRPRRRLAVLALTLLAAAAAAPASAGEGPVVSLDAVSGQLRSRPLSSPWPRSWLVRPTISRLRLGGGAGVMPVGLAVRLADGLSLDAVGCLDPDGGNAVGLIALELRF
jgi:hypothetical protein